MTATLAPIANTMTPIEEKLNSIARDYVCAHGQKFQQAYDSLSPSFSITTNVENGQNKADITLSFNEAIKDPYNVDNIVNHLLLKAILENFASIIENQ